MYMCSVRCGSIFRPEWSVISFRNFLFFCCTYCIGLKQHLDRLRCSCMTIQMFSLELHRRNHLYSEIFSNTGAFPDAWCVHIIFTDEAMLCGGFGTQYHAGYQEQMSHWPKLPVQVVMDWLKSHSPNLVVADFGCGNVLYLPTFPTSKFHRFWWKYCSLKQLFKLKSCHFHSSLTFATSMLRVLQWCGHATRNHVNHVREFSP